MKNELKLLKKSEEILSSELEILADTKLKSAENYNNIKNKLKNVRYQIKNLAPVNLTVSDHALVRYMERISGVSFDEVRKDIVDSFYESFSIAGDGIHPIHGKFKAVIKGGKVVTIKGII